MRLFLKRGFLNYDIFENPYNHLYRLSQRCYGKKFNEVFKVQTLAKVMTTIASLKKVFTTLQAQEKKFSRPSFTSIGVDPTCDKNFDYCLNLLFYVCPFILYPWNIFLCSWIRENQTLSRKTLKKRWKNQFLSVYHK